MRKMMDGYYKDEFGKYYWMDDSTGELYEVSPDEASAHEPICLLDPTALIVSSYCEAIEELSALVDRMEEAGNYEASGALADLALEFDERVQTIIGGYFHEPTEGLEL